MGKWVIYMPKSSGIEDGLDMDVNDYGVSKLVIDLRQERLQIKLVIALRGGIHSGRNNAQDN